MAFEILEYIQTHHQIQEVKKEVKKKEIRKENERVIHLKNIAVNLRVDKDIESRVLELRDLVSNWVDQIEALNFSPYSGKLHRLQYAYFYLVNTKQVVEDYFPTYLQKVLLPKLDKDIAILQLKINKYLLITRGDTEEGNSFYNALEDYLSQFHINPKENREILKIKNIFLPLETFSKSLDREMLKIQAKEEKYFGKELEPMSPKRKAMVYILDVEKLLGKDSNVIDLKPIANLLLNYAENKSVKPTEQENYQYYIEMLEENKNFFY